METLKNEVYKAKPELLVSLENTRSFLDFVQFQQIFEKNDEVLLNWLYLLYSEILIDDRMFRPFMMLDSVNSSSEDSEDEEFKYSLKQVISD